MLQLDHTCSIQRNTAIGTNGRKGFTAKASGLRCLFLPMSRQAAIQNGFDVGYTWDVYFDDGTDVKVGDRLVWNGTNYIVNGKQAFTGLAAAVNHVHLTATTENSNGQ